jgi:hypothetical protein
MKIKDGVLFALLLVAGIVVGSMLGEVTRPVAGLSWLSYSKTVGISADRPLTLDLSVLRLAFGLELRISVAQVLCIIAGIFAYRRLR